MLPTSQFLQAVKIAKANYSGVVFAGKMHGAGSNEPVVQEDLLLNLIKEGADGILLPTVGIKYQKESLLKKAHQITQKVQELGGLVMSTIGTSQESADQETIRRFALATNVGVDVHHIGDGGYGRMAPPGKYYCILNCYSWKETYLF